MTNEGEIVGVIMYLTMRMKGWLQQPKEALSGPQKSRKPNELSSEWRTLEACENQTADLCRSEWLKTVTKKWIPFLPGDPALLSSKFSHDTIVPLSSQEGICDSFWKQECCGCQAHSPGCWLRVWPYTDQEGSPVMCGPWCNSPAHHQAEWQL